jgi:hypothetical protein
MVDPSKSLENFTRYCPNATAPHCIDSTNATRNRESECGFAISAVNHFDMVLKNRDATLGAEKI